MQSSDILAATRRRETGAANTFRLVADPPVFVRGDGPWLWDASGRRFLDLVCGSATTSLGHNHPSHRAAMARAIDTGVFHTGTRLPSGFRAELYEALANLTPTGLDVFHLANSGAEAIEAAIKAAQFATGRKRLIAFAGGYHGRTLGALSVTSGAAIRRSFSLLADMVDVAPYPPQDAAAAEVDAALATLSGILDRRAAEGTPVASIILEAVQGVRGVIEPPATFLAGVRAAATRAGAVLTFDEIWNGFGRAGRWFGFERAGVLPDLVVMGKALSSSLPLSAVAGPASILKAWPPGMHTSTFQGNPLACACAVATIETLREQDLITRSSRAIEPLLAEGLRPLVGQYKVVSVRVTGAQAAIAFQAQAAHLAIETQRIALEAGVLVYGGGAAGECVMLLPPLNIDLAVLAGAVAQIVAIIEKL